MIKRTVDESEILKPRDPSLQDDDDWEEFTLSNVEVYDADGDELTSLVAAEEGTPLLVVGKLDRLPQHLQQYLYDRFSLPATVRVSDVQRFAYGQYDDGEIALWAAGRAGWFKIRPARSYKAIYRDMIDAITLLYFLVDLFGETKSKKKQVVSMDRVFRRIVEEPELRCTDVPEAEHLVGKHSTFLLKCMVKKKESVEWSGTSIFKYLNEQASSAPPGGSKTPRDRTNDDNSDDFDEFDHARLARKGKSALRPRSGKYSMKGAARQQPNDEESNNDVMDTDDDDVQRIRAGSPLKRKNSATHDSSRQKRAQTDELVSQQEGESSSGGMAEREPSLPLRAQPSSTNRKQPTRKRRNEPTVKIIEEPLPSFEPQGPGDTWTCTFDGCMHRVYAASTPQSRALIKEHFHSHAVENQAQLDLVFQEERPYLPVSNLVKRIREMAAQRSKPPPIGTPKEGVGG